jgi:glutamate-5-semialdehyde dehydrogenase
MGHADGRCCAYVHSDASLACAEKVVLDSKLDYPAACNALETLLVHESLLPNGIRHIVSELVEKGVELRCEDDVLRALEGMKGVIRATDEDIVTEFLDLKLYIRSVKSMDEGSPTSFPFSNGLQRSIISIQTHLITQTR